jgi:hypothetical protein
VDDDDVVLHELGRTEQNGHRPLGRPRRRGSSPGRSGDEVPPQGLGVDVELERVDRGGCTHRRVEVGDSPGGTPSATSSPTRL